tara:strand:+ start:802 stop:1095 length:294 start_codon:yes stop_codon:yes gene_type:complete
MSYNDKEKFMDNIRSKEDEEYEQFLKERWGIVDDPDPIVSKVIQRISDRSKEGIKKYGCTMEREDIDTAGWIDNAIEELLDGAIYLERLKVNILKKD